MISNEENTADMLESNILTKNPRSYLSLRVPNEKEYLPGKRVRERYVKTFGPKTRYPRFICKIELKCLIDNAPLTVQDRYQTLLEEVYTTEELSSKDMTASTSTIFSKGGLRRWWTGHDDKEEVYSVAAEFHLLSPMGLSNEEIELFEMYWSE